MLSRLAAEIQQLPMADRDSVCRPFCSKLTPRGNSQRSRIASSLSVLRRPHHGEGRDADKQENAGHHEQGPRVNPDLAQGHPLIAGSHGLNVQAGLIQRVFGHGDYGKQTQSVCHVAGHVPVPTHDARLARWNGGDGPGRTNGFPDAGIGGGWLGEDLPQIVFAVWLAFSPYPPPTKSPCYHAWRVWATHSLPSCYRRTARPSQRS